MWSASPVHIWASAVLMLQCLSPARAPTVLKIHLSDATSMKII